MLSEKFIGISQLGFESERLYMRRFEDEDLEELYDICRQPEVGPNCGWKPHENISETKKYIEQCMHSREKIVFAIEDRRTEKLLGGIGIMKDAKRDDDNILEIGYNLGKEYWGQGYMTEAVKALLKFCFRKLGVPMITVYHFPENDRSRRVIEKCGFKREGTIRAGYKRFDGVLMDEVCYSMTKEEYEEMFHVEQK